MLAEEEHGELLRICDEKRVEVETLGRRSVDYMAYWRT
jgi:hypothetical protein